MSEKNDKLYEAEFVLEDMEVRNGIKLWYKKGHKMFSVCTLVLGIMCIFPALVYIGVIVIPAVSVFFFVASGMFLIFHFKGYIFATDTEIKALHRMFETNENCGKFHYTFYDDMFEMSTKIATKKIMYNDINSVYDNDEVIILAGNGRRLFFVAKKGVLDQQNQELLEFLQKKTLTVK